MSLTSPLRITVPVKITDAILAGTDVPEADYGAWDGGNTYAKGDRCIKAHRIWESAQAGNLNHDPQTAGAAWWLEVSATNRWSWFDLEQVTTTSKPTSFYYELEPGQPVDSAHVLGLVNTDSVQVRVYDTADDALKFDSGQSAAGLLPVDPDWWCYCYGPWVLSDQQHYTALPYVVAPRIRVDMAGGANLGAQVLLIGNDTVFGKEHGTGVLRPVRIRYARGSQFKDNEFNIPTMRKSALVVTATFTLKVRSSSVDELADFYRDHGAKVCLFTISELWRITQVLGVITSFEPLINGPEYSEFAFEIRGVPQQ